MVSRLRRSVLDRIRFHGLTPVATGIPPLRGSRRKRLRRGISYIQNVQTPELVKCEMACCAMSNVLNQKTKWVNGPFKQVQYTSHNSHLTFDKWGGQPIRSHLLKPATTYLDATSVASQVESGYDSANYSHTSVEVSSAEAI